MRHYPLVQITDNEGKVVGAVAMPEAFKQELVRHTVYVLLVDSEGKFLLQKRSSTVPNYRCYWDASAGGHIDEGEAPESAAYRELHEELGVADLPLTHVVNFYFESSGDGRTYKYYAHVYKGALLTTELPQGKLDEVEVVDLFSRDEIDMLDKVTPITRHIVTLL